MKKDLRSEIKLTIAQPREMHAFNEVCFFMLTRHSFAGTRLGFSFLPSPQGYASEQAAQPPFNRSIAITGAWVKLGRS